MMSTAAGSGTMRPPKSPDLRPRRRERSRVPFVGAPNLIFARPDDLLGERLLPLRASRARQAPTVGADSENRRGIDVSPTLGCDLMRHYVAEYFFRARTLAWNRCAGKSGESGIRGAN